MKKVYVIMSETRTEFVFTSMKKAMEQIEVIRRRNQDGTWWADLKPLEEVYALPTKKSALGYYPLGLRYKLRFKTPHETYVNYMVYEVELNKGYGI